MINITKIICNDTKETAVIDIQLEKDSETINIHAVGYFVDIIDSQGYCDNWTFLVDGVPCDVEYSRFEEYSFGDQVACAISTWLYPSEQIKICLNKEKVKNHSEAWPELHM